MPETASKNAKKDLEETLQKRSKKTRKRKNRAFIVAIVVYAFVVIFDVMMVSIETLNTFFNENTALSIAVGIFWLLLIIAATLNFIITIIREE